MMQTNFSPRNISTNKVERVVPNALKDFHAAGITPGRGFAQRQRALGRHYEIVRPERRNRQAVVKKKIQGGWPAFAGAPCDRR